MASERLFYALMPDEELQQALHDQGMAWKSRFRGRLTALETIHLTLFFIGSVEESVTRCLLEHSADIQLPAFDLRLDTACHWPRPKVVWMGPRIIPDELRYLHEAVRGLVADCGLNVEGFPYRPHITLYRKVRKAPSCLQVQPLHWPVRDFALVRSKTLPSGPVYEILQRWPLIDEKNSHGGMNSPAAME